MCSTVVQRFVMGDVTRQCRVHCAAIARCQQVQEQTTNDGDAQPSVGTRSLGRHAALDGVGGDGFDPGIDNVMQQFSCAGPTLQCVSVDLENNRSCGASCGSVKWRHM